MTNTKDRQRKQGNKIQPISEEIFTEKNFLNLNLYTERHTMDLRKSTQNDQHPQDMFW